MTGAHEFKVTVQLAPEDSGQCIVDLKYTVMHSDREWHVKSSCWMCPAKDGLPIDTIRDVLIASCDWLNNYVEKEAIHLSDNHIALNEAEK